MLLGFILVGVAIAAPDKDSVQVATPPTRPRLVTPDLSTGTVAPTTPAGIGLGTSDTPGGRQVLRGFGEVQVTIIGEDGKPCEVCLMAATTEAQRRRGLMRVLDESLGGYDGMLFEYPTSVQGAFWMRNTPLPLSIAFFDDTGRMVSRTDMAPCGDSKDCPTYPPGAPYRFAIEMPQGRFPLVGIGRTASIRINARDCTAAEGGR
jgi:uncharacterized membrane protein (UPF0127 family)